MHAWLFVLAVLAISQGATQVAGTDDNEAAPSLQPSTASTTTAVAVLADRTVVASGRQGASSAVGQHAATGGSASDSAPSETTDSGVAAVDATAAQNPGPMPAVAAAAADEGPVLPGASVDHVERTDGDGGDSESLDPKSSDGAADVNGSGSGSDSSSKPDPKTLVEIEKNLLSLFGFPNRPKIDRSKVVIPDAMKQLYAQIMGHDLIDSVNLPKEGLNTRNANTVRSFTHEESPIDDRFQHHHRFRLLFNLSSIPRNEKLRAAELTLSRDAILDERARRVHLYKVLVYDIVRPGVKGKRSPSFLLVDSKALRINETGTVSFDVMPAVDRWLRNPKRNHGLFVQVVGRRTAKPRKVPRTPAYREPEHRHVRLRRSIADNRESWSQQQPLLFTYTDDGRHKQRPIRDAINGANRARRAPARKSNRRKSGSELCQRKPLYVDFSDVGWNDWIVAPPGYEAYFCQGDCRFPIADHLNTTNHAIVQTLVNSYNSALAPKACCVPTQLSSISMLYLNDQNKVVLKNYQDMTVVGCGCR